MPQPIVIPSSPGLVESEDSPQIELSERIRKRRTFRGKFADCLAAMLPRGTLTGGDDAGFRVASCSLQKSTGGMGVLVFELEGVSPASGMQLPPDEVSVTPLDVSPRVESHRKYKPLAGQTVTVEDDTGNPVQFTYTAAIMNAARATDPAVRKKFADAIASNSLARELLGLLEQGVEVFYLAGFRYIWTQHSWNIPIIVGGGVIESPLGPLAGYFHPSLQFLREADALEERSGVWRITRSWLGLPDGQWATQLYF